MRDAPLADQGAPDRSEAEEGPSPKFILPEGEAGSHGVGSMPCL
jgi:hypothetical protein